MEKNMSTNYKAVYAVYDVERETVLSSFVIAEFGGLSADWETKSKNASKAAHKCKQDWLRTESDRRLDIIKIVRNPNGGFSALN